MQIVVAQHANRTGAQSLCPSKHLEIALPPIHHIADQPDPVTPPIEANPVQQFGQSGKTTLNVAYCVCAHDRSNITSNSQTP
jgi:hypothetical protein